MDKKIAVRHVIAESRPDLEWPDSDFLAPNFLVTFRELRQFNRRQQRERSFRNRLCSLRLLLFLIRVSSVFDQWVILIGLRPKTAPGSSVAEFGSTWAPICPREWRVEHDLVNPPRREDLPRVVRGRIAGVSAGSPGRRT